ncbi:MAG TPA: hypothetical protein GXX36_03305 [Clostridiaceae bacterium]|nr:hypothetical protein [Clostridiaceae bacterium]
MARDVRQFSDAEIERLVKFYEQAEREILDRINRALLRANKTEYLVQMKRNIEAILQQLREGNRTWCTDSIPRVYSEGLKNADAMLKDAGFSVSAGFGAIHQQAVQVLAENTFQRLQDVTQVIGRQAEGIYRDLALENVRGAVAGYETWKQAAKRYRQQLAEHGVTGFKDKAGRNWNMRSYTEMVARTTTMEAHLQGTANRLVEQGHDLVKVSTHRGACEKCAPWQGKILSITGKTPGYPTLEEAKAAGLFHPRCRHAYGLHIDLDKEIEELEAELDMQLETDENYTNKQEYGTIKIPIDKILEEAAKNEPQITQDMQRIVTQNGGRLEGLEFRLKSRSSLEEKATTMVAGGVDEENVLSGIYDVVRYTDIIDKQNFTSHYFSVIDSLKRNGYKVKRVKNTWTNKRSAYKGVNVVLEAPNGQMFELQFHTPESFDVKQNKMHKLYEEHRKNTTSENRKLELENEMFEISKALEMPAGIERIKNIDLLRGD